MKVKVILDLRVGYYSRQIYCTSFGQARSIVNKIFCSIRKNILIYDGIGKQLRIHVEFSDGFSFNDIFFLSEGINGRFSTNDLIDSLIESNLYWDCVTNIRTWMTRQMQLEPENIIDSNRMEIHRRLTLFKSERMHKEINFDWLLKRLVYLRKLFNGNVFSGPFKFNDLHEIGKHRR